MLNTLNIVTDNTRMKQRQADTKSHLSSIFRGKMCRRRLSDNFQHGHSPFSLHRHRHTRVEIPNSFFPHYRQNRLFSTLPYFDQIGNGLVAVRSSLAELLWIFSPSNCQVQSNTDLPRTTQSLIGSILQGFYGWLLRRPAWPSSPVFALCVILRLRSYLPLLCPSPASLSEGYAQMTSAEWGGSPESDQGFVNLVQG